MEFSNVITQFWLGPFVGTELVAGGDLHIVCNPELAFDRRVTFLARTGLPLQVTVTPEVAEKLELNGSPDLTESQLRAKLVAAGTVMHEPDLLFNFTVDAASSLAGDPPVQSLGVQVCQLTADDQDLFAAFEGANSPEDLDVAWVSLADWAAFGAVVHGELVCVASAYPWGSGEVADIGILTSPHSRGQGYAAAVVRAISGHIYDQGLEPQYRTQPDNVGSHRTALAAGMTQYGVWETVTPEDSED